MVKLPQISPTKRLYIVLIAAIGLLLIGLAAGAYGANNLLAAQATKLTNLKAKSLALDQEQQSFIKAKKDIKTYAGLEKIAQAVVPEDKDQAQTVREIVNIAAANNISLSAINFPVSTLGGAAAAQSSQGVATSPSPSASSNLSAGKLSQLIPVKSIPGVYNLLITVQSDSNNPVPYTSFISFLDALEHNRRTAQISTITLQPNSTNRNLLNFTLTLNEYIKP
jgi:acyl-CoA reductase-like NAD-dependent aldehyde dehydrogenase